MTVQVSTSFVVETALLGQGLVSVNSTKIKELWPDGALVTWLQKGRIKLGSIEEFLYYRDQNKSWRRLDGLTLYEGLQEGADGFLTASAAMVVAEDLGCPIVVSAGLGGIGDIIAERLCYDLPALAKIEITLVATSPKDMLDISGTIGWLHKNYVKTFGVGTEYCDGYVFVGQKTQLMQPLNCNELGPIVKGHNLILNPIPHGKRLQNPFYLREAIKAGKLAEQRGEHFHPAANRRLDELSQGCSSEIQLDSLIANIAIARSISVN
ncbi:MAG: pseudouridine-5'-phosphate glycosidase [Syntrophomonas sp.]|nr:pseudouridine-5'-phosphate glycosidase [Syntrophomonas sp.]